MNRAGQCGLPGASREHGSARIVDQRDRVVAEEEEVEGQEGERAWANAWELAVLARWRTAGVAALGKC